MKQGKRLSVADIEAMTTHELADLLANIVLVLRRLPEVPMKELRPEENSVADTAAELLTKMRGRNDSVSQVVPSWLENE